MKNQNTIQKIAKAQKILRKAKLVLMVLAVMMTALTGTVFAADPLGTAFRILSSRQLRLSD